MSEKVKENDYISLILKDFNFLKLALHMHFMSYRLKSFDTTILEPTNQNSIKEPEVFKLVR